MLSGAFLACVQVRRVARGDLAAVVATETCASLPRKCLAQVFGLSASLLSSGRAAVLARRMWLGHQPDSAQRSDIELPWSAHCCFCGVWPECQWIQEQLAFETFESQTDFFFVLSNHRRVAPL